MADEIAGVGIRVDTDDVSKGIKALDALADQGPKVEKSLQGVETTAAKTGKSLKSLGDGGADAGLSKVAKTSKDAADGVGKLADSATKSAAAVKQVDKASADTAKAITGVGSAVKALVSSNEAVVTSIRGMSAAQTAYTDKLAEEARQLRATVSERDKYIAQTAGMLAASKEIAAAVGSRVDALRQVQTASTQASESMFALGRAGVAAFVGGALISGAKEAAAAIYEASAAGERLRTMLNFATGGRSAEEIEYLRKVTNRLGLEFTSTATAYGQFQAAAKGTNLEGQKARDIFESIAKASAVMGLSTEQSSGALLALQQIISKGTVQAEELRGQLGERLPGAFQIAAKAMGVTTAELGKMLEQGLVVADDFLPKFARALNENLGGAAESAADRLDAATNRLGNAWERLKQSVGDAGVSKFIQSELKAVSDDVTVFTETMEKVGKNGGGFLAQITAGGAVEAGRAGFAILNGSANLLNGTINALTGNVLNLRTDLAVLPDIFKTNAQQAAAMAQDLARAEKEFAALQARGAATSPNIYLRSEFFQLGEYIKKLKEAQAEQAKLQAGPSYSAARDSQSASASEAQRIEAVKTAMQKVQQSLAGVKDSFYKDLNALKSGYDEGLIKLDAYQEAVAKLIDQSGGGKATAAAAKASNKELEEQKKLVAELAGLSGDFYEDWERLNALFKSGAFKTVDQLAEAQAKLLDKQPIAAYAKAEIEAAKAIADARTSARRAEEKAIEDFTSKQREAAAATLKSIQDRTSQLEVENAAAVVARNENISLAEAINKVTIARLQDKAAGLQSGSEAQQDVLRQIEAYKTLGQQLSNKELNSFLDPDRAKSFGEALTGAFEAAGNGLARLSSALQAYGSEQLKISARSEALKKDPPGAERDRAAALLAERSQRNQIALYASMTGAAKGFFREGSKGYKALEAAENTFRVVQLASDLQKGLSAAAVGVATQAQGDPYTAVPRMAAMAAIMAGLGFAVGGIGGGGGTRGGGDGAPQATGAGTSLGDASKLSASIGSSIDRLSETSKLQLTTQSGMLAALRNIENSIGGVANLVSRSNSGDLTTGSSFGVNTGTSLYLADPFSRGVFAKVGDTITNKIYEGLFGKKVSITGTGLNVPQQSLGQAINNSQLQQYIDTYTTKKFFGIKVGSSASTQYQGADPQLANQFTSIFKSFYDGVKLAAGPLGESLNEVEARLNGFVLNIGKIDLQNLTGEEIQEKLTAVLGAAADNIAAAAIPGLQAFQQVGEGYFETIVRVASGVELATASLEPLGLAAISFGDIARKQGDVAAEIVRQSIAAYEAADGSLSSIGSLINTLDASAEDIANTYKSLVDVRDILLAVGESGDSLTASMIRGAAGLENLQESLSTYLGGKFFTDQERAAAAMQSLQGQFARIGIETVPQSYAAFRALVEGIDTSTESGQKLYGQVIGLAGAFQTAQEQAEKAGAAVTAAASRLPDILKSQAAESAGLMVDLLTAQGDAAGAAALKRQQELTKLTEGLTAAEAALATAGYDANAALRAQIDATKAAASAAQQAAQAEAQRAASVASERDGIQQRIDELLGNTAAIRARELAGLDASNRELQERYYLLIDAQAAQEAANRAAEEAARAAEEQARAAEQLRDAWKSVGQSLMDEARRILGLNASDGGQSLAQIQARFGITTAQARAGDKAAAESLPEISQTLLQLAEANANSLLDLKRIRAQIAASLEQTAGSISTRFGLGLPSFDVGTPYVPRDMVAMVHEGEAIVPRQFNPAAGGSMGASNELVKEVRTLRQKTEKQSEEIIRLNTRMTQILERWEFDGLPPEQEREA